MPASSFTGSATGRKTSAGRGKGELSEAREQRTSLVACHTFLCTRDDVQRIRREQHDRVCKSRAASSVA